MTLTYFAEDNAGNGRLWATDGTATGTDLVKVFPGSRVYGLKMIGARVFFVVDDGQDGNGGNPSTSRMGPNERLWAAQAPRRESAA